MPSGKLSAKSRETVLLSLIDHFFKPSALITAIILVVFLVMAVTDLESVSVCQDAIKILCGALAGAIAGEHALTLKEENQK